MLASAQWSGFPMPTVSPLKSISPFQSRAQHIGYRREHELTTNNASPLTTDAPRPLVRALFPNEELGADQTINSLLDFKPEEWGLPAFPKDA